MQKKNRHIALQNMEEPGLSALEDLCQIVVHTSFLLVPGVVPYTSNLQSPSITI